MLRCLDLADGVDNYHRTGIRICQIKNDITDNCTVYNNNNSFIEIPILQLITELHWVLNQDIELHKWVKLITNRN